MLREDQERLEIVFLWEFDAFGLFFVMNRVDLVGGIIDVVQQITISRVL